eukprot:360591-Chlamydomonas_euryale.AAC.25
MDGFHRVCLSSLRMSAWVFKQLACRLQQARRMRLHDIATACMCTRTCWGCPPDGLPGGDHERGPALEFLCASGFAGVSSTAPTGRVTVVICAHARSDVIARGAMPSRQSRGQRLTSGRHNASAARRVYPTLNPAGRLTWGPSCTVHPLGASARVCLRPTARLPCSPYNEEAAVALSNSSTGGFTATGLSSGTAGRVCRANSSSSSGLMSFPASASCCCMERLRARQTHTPVL